MLFCEVSPGGIGSTGLGNRLLPWARCVIYARSHGVPMLVTRWTQLPVGSLRRRDAEPRFYANLFIRRDNDVCGWRRTYIRMQAKKLPEPANLSANYCCGGGLNLVVFAGVGMQFRPLRSWHELVRRELLAITRQNWRERADSIAVPFIGIHIRRGDFQRLAAGTDFSQTDNAATPLEWFTESLKCIRVKASLTLPAIVTSDGTDNELRPLLAMPNVRRVTTGSAIGDLLVLSRSSVLLASGSSFSAWASYLGQMPTLTHPGQSLARLFGLERAAQQFIAEFDPFGLVPPALFVALDRLLKAPRSLAGLA
jgi:hypothetical protein